MSMQERAQHHMSQLDKELSRYPALHNFEQQTSVPKVYAVLGLGALYFFLVFFNIAGEFLVNVAGFAIPGYYSLEALFSSNKKDDEQWLTYWVTFAFLTFLHPQSRTESSQNILEQQEHHANKLASVLESMVSAVYWFPFYYTFKFVLVLWMALPQTSGAQVIYRNLLQPVFAKYFEGHGSASANLRSQVNQATGKSM
ncbi:MAG: hypothetical protein Q9162_003730 [Coniocarpon cinnabarinum]